MEKELNWPNFTQEHAENVRKTLPYESEITNCPLSGKLEHTEVILFKAMRPDLKFLGPELSKSILAIPDNNISEYITKPLSIVPVEKCHHSNMLDDISIYKSILI